MKIERFRISKNKTPGMPFYDKAYVYVAFLNNSFLHHINQDIGEYVFWGLLFARLLENHNKNAYVNLY